MGSYLGLSQPIFGGSHLQCEVGRLRDRSNVLAAYHVLGDIELGRVLRLLIVLPGLLAGSLLIGEPLVVGLKFLQLLVLAHRHLVLEHASHAGGRLGLLGVFCCLVHSSVGQHLFLIDLLGGPVLDQSCIGLHSGAVVEILTLELAAAGNRLRQLLRREVGSLGGALHIII